MSARVAAPPKDETVVLEGEPYVRIRAYDRLPKPSTGCTTRTRTRAR
jgi:hypothetical protein